MVTAVCALPKWQYFPSRMCKMKSLCAASNNAGQGGVLTSYHGYSKLEKNSRESDYIPRRSNPIYLAHETVREQISSSPRVNGATAPGTRPLSI